MPYIHFSEQEKELAKQADIVRFLQAHGEQVKRTGKEFAWDSPAGKVTIRENQWYSQYEQTGGGAVKFLRKFFGMTYPEAVRSLLGESAGQEIRAAVKEKPKPEPKNFSPPPPHSDMRRLYAYLLSERGIDRDIINEIKTKRIQSLSSALDVALEEFKTLQARLNEIDEPLNSFDPKLFEEVIKGMTVNNRDEMTFRLIGDLTFTVRL